MDIDKNEEAKKVIDGVAKAGIEMTLQLKSNTNVVVLEKLYYNKTA